MRAPSNEFFPSPSQFIFKKRWKKWEKSLWTGREMRTSFDNFQSFRIYVWRLYDTLVNSQSTQSTIKKSLVGCWKNFFWTSHSQLVTTLFLYSHISMISYFFIFSFFFKIISVIVKKSFTHFLTLLLLVFYVFFFLFIFL